MATAITLSFIGGSKIGYVVRYKPSHTESPPDGGHSDCILPTGAPVGYFGSGVVGARGVVFAYSHFRASRPAYVNMTDARSTPCLSTILVMDVGPARARAFRDAWLAMRAKTDGFTIMGNNCATHASRACYAAGIIRTAEVSGVDTPNNLYEQIVDDGLVGWRSYSGYLGFAPLASGTDELLLDFTVTLEPTVIATVGGPGGGGGSSS